MEGLGEVAAVPLLIRRIAVEVEPTLEIAIPHPIRVTKGQLLKPGELERAVKFAALNAEVGGGILVILDSDDSCPATLGPQLLARVRAARSDLPSAVVLANREFEAWFLASAESLRGYRGLPDDLQSPANPEEIRGAKEWLERYVPYAPTIDQAAFTSTFEFSAARRAPSFDKCYRDITRLLGALRAAYAR